MVAILAALPLTGRITEVSAFGVTAKLREEVKRAEDVVVSLRAVAKVIGEDILRNIASGYYFWDSKTIRDRLESRDRVLNLLRSLDLSEADIAQIDAPSRFYIASWLHEAIRKVAFPSVAQDRNGQFMRDFDAARDFVGGKPARPEQLKSILTQYDVLNEQTKGWLESYSRFLRGGEVERRQELAQVLNRAEG